MVRMWTVTLPGRVRENFSVRQGTRAPGRLVGRYSDLGGWIGMGAQSEECVPQGPATGQIFGGTTKYCFERILGSASVGSRRLHHDPNGSGSRNPQRSRMGCRQSATGFANRERGNGT